MENNTVFVNAPREVADLHRMPEPVAQLLPVPVCGNETAAPGALEKKVARPAAEAESESESESESETETETEPETEPESEESGYDADKSGTDSADELTARGEAKIELAFHLDLAQTAAQAQAAAAAAAAADAAAFVQALTPVRAQALVPVTVAAPCHDAFRGPRDGDSDDDTDASFVDIAGLRPTPGTGSETSGTGDSAWDGRA